MAEPIVGNFRVTFQFLGDTTPDPVDEEYITPLGIVGDEYTNQETGKFNSDGTKETVPVLVREAPKVSNKQPYEGPLTAHELAFVRGLPGKDFNYRYRFTVEPLD